RFILCGVAVVAIGFLGAAVAVWLGGGPRGWVTDPKAKVTLHSSKDVGKITALRSLGQAGGSLNGRRRHAWNISVSVTTTRPLPDDFTLVAHFVSAKGAVLREVGLGPPKSTLTFGAPREIEPPWGSFEIPRPVDTIRLVPASRVELRRASDEGEVVVSAQGGGLAQVTVKL